MYKHRKTILQDLLLSSKRQFYCLIARRRLAIRIDQTSIRVYECSIQQTSHRADNKHKQRQNEMQIIWSLSLDEDSVCTRSYDCTRNESRIYRSYECNMQRASHEAENKSRMTSECDRDIEYIVLLLVSLIRLHNRFLSERFDLYVVVYSNYTIIHVMSHSIDFLDSSSLRVCKRRSKRCFLVSSIEECANATKWVAMQSWSASRLVSKTFDFKNFSRSDLLIKMLKSKQKVKAAS